MIIENLQQAIGVLKGDFLNSPDKDKWDMEMSEQSGHLFIRGVRKDDPEMTVEVKISEKAALEIANEE